MGKTLTTKGTTGHKGKKNGSSFVRLGVRRGEKT
jgi:hypothetical protein